MPEKPYYSKGEYPIREPEGLSWYDYIRHLEWLNERWGTNSYNSFLTIQHSGNQYKAQLESTESIPIKLFHSKITLLLLKRPFQHQISRVNKVFLFVAGL